MPHGDLTRNKIIRRSITFLSTVLSTARPCATALKITARRVFRARFARQTPRLSSGVEKKQICYALTRHDVVFVCDY